MNVRDEINRCLAALPQLAAESGSEQIKDDIDMLMGVALQLTTEMANRNSALAKRCQSRKAKPPKASPINGRQKQKNQPSSTDTPKPQNDTENQPQTKSRIMQGVQQAEPTMADQSHCR